MSFGVHYIAFLVDFPLRNFFNLRAWSAISEVMYGMYLSCICSSLRPVQAVGGDPEDFQRGVFAFLGMFDLFENLCGCSMTC